MLKTRIARFVSFCFTFLMLIALAAQFIFNVLIHNT